MQEVPFGSARWCRGVTLGHVEHDMKRFACLLLLLAAGCDVCTDNRAECVDAGFTWVSVQEIPNAVVIVISRQPGIEAVEIP